MFIFWISNWKFWEFEPQSSLVRIQWPVNLRLPSHADFLTGWKIFWFPRNIQHIIKNCTHDAVVRWAVHLKVLVISIIITNIVITTMFPCTLNSGDAPELLFVADAFCDITDSTKWEADNDVTGSMGPGKTRETAVYKLYLVAGRPQQQAQVAGRSPTRQPAYWFSLLRPSDERTSSAATEGARG